MELQDWRKEPRKNYSNEFKLRMVELACRKRKLTAVCSHQTRIGNLDAHLI